MRVALGEPLAGAAVDLVADRYDLTIDGRSFRVLIVGMDTGRPDEHVTLDALSRLAHRRGSRPRGARAAACTPQAQCNAES